ncbi:MAG TPA: alpha/beta hydrolase [Rhodopila sp.]|uniref:alpha/beta fold hydrolase n=1 Tax=Rhodopila sp. TaxID=2480087 RepID=UPI002CA77238|nr:alpha/beta hydrolase [Rhodopila sp.]HVY17550.1 alpha/beta hydrolase [Rhodopila sp.]
MYLNIFADTTAPLDMTGTDEFRSLLASAADLGIPHAPDVPYASCNIVLRRMRFHFLAWGRPDAPPIVLLHGGHQSAHSWDLVSLSLARRYRVLALDQRGHGDSEWSRDVAYANHEMSLDAEAFITAMGLERPVLVGHSMGGRNAMLLTRRSQHLLRALGIVDVGPEVSEKGRAAIAGFVQAAQEFDDLEHFVRKVREYDPYRSRAHIERTVKYNMLERADGKYVSKCDSNPRRLGIVRGTGPMENITLDDARSFDLPVLLVRGGDSNILEADAAERFAAALPQGRLVTVPKAGHNVHGANTKGFLEALEGFLEAVA